jgi:hypothetical protein
MILRFEDLTKDDLKVLDFVYLIEAALDDRKYSRLLMSCPYKSAEVTRLREDPRYMGSAVGRVKGFLGGDKWKDQPVTMYWLGKVEKAYE